MNQRRPRGRNNNNRGGRQNPRNQTFDSNGPEGRVRGSAAQVLERYLAQARDAQAAGDGVLAENLFQHAEHYYRVLSAANAQAEQQQRERQAAFEERDRRNGNGRGDGEDGRDDRAEASSRDSDDADAGEDVSDQAGGQDQDAPEAARPAAAEAPPALKRPRARRMPTRRPAPIWTSPS